MSKMPVGTLVRESNTSMFSTGDSVGVVVMHMATRLTNKTITVICEDFD